MKQIIPEKSSEKLTKVKTNNSQNKYKTNSTLLCLCREIYI